MSSSISVRSSEGQRSPNGSELLGLLEGSELVSHQESGPEVIVAVVARSGGCQDGGNESIAVLWVVVPHRRNWASATPNQAARLAVQKLGSLKK